MNNIWRHQSGTSEFEQAITGVIEQAVGGRRCALNVVEVRAVSYHVAVCGDELLCMDIRRGEHYPANCTKIALGDPDSFEKLAKWYAERGVEFRLP